METRELLRSWLKIRLDAASRRWLDMVCEEVRSDADVERFCGLISLCSRYLRKTALAPTDEERAAAWTALEGWNPERWTILEAGRVLLLLHRPDLAEDPGVSAIEEAFRFADAGELCALYKSLAHLPDPARLKQRAAEGCRSSMRTVFESTACDTPYPFRWFDDLAWNQALIKCLFIEAPLIRIHGVDRRLNGELARMALDLADERRSAGRPVHRELWMCLGAHGGSRAVDSLELEVRKGHPSGRIAAAYGLGRAGARERIQTLLREELPPAVATALRESLAGPITQQHFARLVPEG